MFSALRRDGGSQSSATQQIREARIRAQAVVSGIDLQVSEPRASAGIGFFQPGKRAIQVAHPGTQRPDLITVGLPLGFERADSQLQKSRSEERRVGKECIFSRRLKYRKKNK